MKIKKLKGDWSGDTLAMCQMINALDRARIVSNACADNADFQNRCTDAIVALASRVLEDSVELSYEPEMKRFRVTYDVKRSGVHTMEVDAETEEDAKNLVQSRLERMEESEFDGMKTDFLAAEVFEAEEVRG